MELTKQLSITRPDVVGVNTPVRTKSNSSAQPTFKSSQSNANNAQEEITPRAEENPEIGKLASWRGVLVLVITGGAMFMDEVFMTSTNISLSAIQKEFNVQSSDLQWSISAYTLTFGGFLLLSGVLSDRYGRKPLLIGGLIWLSIWTLAIGFCTSFIQMTVFRGLQGIGAALTIPSSIGIVSSYFTGQDRTRALGIYSAAGALGFTAGLILGGLLSSSLGWRYIFRLLVIASGLLAIISFIVLPRNNRVIDKSNSNSNSQAGLDYFGATLSTAALVLLAFVLSSGGIYGWAKAFIIVLLILSVGMLFLFAYYEKKISNPIMPLSLWKIRNFASIWIVGFTVQGSYTAVLYYTVLIAQQVDNLSPLQTSIRFIPSGVLGFVITILTALFLEFIDGKWIIILGLSLSTCAPVASCLLSGHTEQFWVNVLPTSFISLTGVSIGYIAASTLMLVNVPMNVKSLCGGMINTAYQVGGGVTLAICSAVVQAVDIDKGHGVAQQYSTGLWCAAGISGIGLLVSVFCLKNDHSALARRKSPEDSGNEMVEHTA